MGFIMLQNSSEMSEVENGATNASSSPQTHCDPFVCLWREPFVSQLEARQLLLIYGG